LIAKVRNHVHFLKANGRLQSARIVTVNSQTNLNVKPYKGTQVNNALKYVSGPQAGTWRGTA
jgi:hypothetical protein